MKFSIIGTHEESTFDERVFNVGTLIGFFITFTSVIINQINNYPLIYHIVLGSLSALFAFMYYLSRFKKLSRYLRIPFIIVFSLCNITAWFFSGGLNGSTAFLIIFSVIGSPFIIKTNRTYVFIFIFITAVFLIATQWLYPETIMAYPDKNSELIDLSITLIIVLGISAYTMHINNSMYEKEQKIIETQKKEISEQAVELKSINNKLVELDKFKELMTGMVIHDLKNPLSSIIGLSNQQNSEKNLKLIRQSSKQMLNLVMNILDVHKFDTTEIKLNCVNIKLSDLLKMVFDSISGIIEEKNIELEIIGKTDYIAFVDILLIERVFINILSNAIKYSDNNTKIIIDVFQEHNKVKIGITDFGKGIEPKNLSKVFDKFAQINTQKSGVLRSTGLGLAFCKMVINAHNCSIGVSSELGKYTTFKFELNSSDTLENTVQTDSYNFNKKNEIRLTALEKTHIEPYIKQLKSLKYYEIGKLIPILNLIDENLSPNITLWKTDLENAVYSNNEQLYNQLINI